MWEEEEENKEELGGKKATRFRAPATRMNYFAADRPDIQCGVKRVCQGMSKPRSGA